MVRCPNCNDELGAETFCRACGTSVEHPGDDQPHGDGQPYHERETPPRQRTEHGPHRTGRQPPASRNPRRPHRQRRGLPGGLKLLAAALALFGVGSLFGAVMLNGVTQRAAVYGPAVGGAGLADFAIVFAVIGAADLAAAYGLWTRQSWGWTAGMVALGAGVLSGLLVVANGPAGMGLFSAVVSGGMAWYLHEHRWVYADGGQDHSPGSRRRTRPRVDEQSEGR